MSKPLNVVAGTVMVDYAQLTGHGNERAIPKDLRERGHFMMGHVDSYAAAYGPEFVTHIDRALFTAKAIADAAHKSEEQMLRMLKTPEFDFVRRHGRLPATLPNSLQAAVGSWHSAFEETRRAASADNERNSDGTFKKSPRPSDRGLGRDRG